MVVKSFTREIAADAQMFLDAKSFIGGKCSAVKSKEIVFGGFIFIKFGEDCADSLGFLPSHE